MYSCPLHFRLLCTYVYSGQTRAHVYEWGSIAPYGILRDRF